MYLNGPFMWRNTNGPQLSLSSWPLNWSCLQWRCQPLGLLKLLGSWAYNLWDCRRGNKSSKRWIQPFEMCPKIRMEGEQTKTRPSINQHNERISDVGDIIWSSRCMVEFFGVMWKLLGCEEWNEWNISVKNGDVLCSPTGKPNSAESVMGLLLAGHGKCDTKRLLGRFEPTRQGNRPSWMKCFSLGLKVFSDDKPL